MLSTYPRNAQARIRWLMVAGLGLAWLEACSSDSSEPAKDTGRDAASSGGGSSGGAKATGGASGAGGSAKGGSGGTSGGSGSSATGGTGGTTSGPDGGLPCVGFASTFEQEITTEIVDGAVISRFERCKFRLLTELPPKADGGTNPFDFSTVNVQIAVSGTPTTRVGHVSASAACVNGRGWYYETPAVVSPDAGGGGEPTFSVVVLCPSTCDALMSLANPRLQSVYGCPTTPEK